MAFEDVVVATYLWQMVVPLTFIFIAHIFMRGKYQSFYNRIYAYGISQFAVRYNRKCEHHKQSLFEPLKISAKDRSTPLKILEIGAGSGSNFKYYPSADVVCLEPKAEFKQYITDSANRYPHVRVVDFVVSEAERMNGIESESVDAVVCTLVLCSVSDVQMVLQEVKRVLKPGGKFYYLEHVCADWSTDKLVYIVQTVLSPLWRLIADGCVFNRKTGLYINNAGFSHVKQEFISILSRKVLFKVIKSHLKGVATK